MKDGNNAFEQLKIDLLDYLIKQYNFPAAIQLWTRSDYLKAAKVFTEQLSNHNNSLKYSEQQVDNYISNSTL